MLKMSYYTEPSELDQLIFTKLVPAEHYLRKVKALFDFESMRALVADCYSADMGRGAEDPVLMIKLGFLQFHYGLSDRASARRSAGECRLSLLLGIVAGKPLAVGGLDVAISISAGE